MQPKRTKYKRYFKPRKLPITSTKLKNLRPQSTVNLIALESSYINSKQIESARQSIRRKLKRQGNLTIHILPDIGISLKSTSSRMGKGKGKISFWSGRVKAGIIVFKLRGIPLKSSTDALKSGSNKLPFKTKICNK